LKPSGHLPNHAGDLSRATGHLRAAVAKRRGRPPAASFLLQGFFNALESNLTEDYNLDFDVELGYLAPFLPFIRPAKPDGPFLKLPLLSLEEWEYFKLFSKKRYSSIRFGKKHVYELPLVLMELKRHLIKKSFH
jgi:hypothetical protein